MRLSDSNLELNVSFFFSGIAITNMMSCISYALSEKFRSNLNLNISGKRQVSNDY